MHQAFPLIFILFIFLLRFSYNATEDKKLEKSLTLTDWMENYPEEQETGNTGVSNINADDHDKDFTFPQLKTEASNETYNDKSFPNMGNNFYFDNKHTEIVPLSTRKIEMENQMKVSNHEMKDKDSEDEISEDEDFSFNISSNIQGPVVKETKEKIRDRKYNEKGQNLSQDRSNRNTQQSIQSSLHPRANTKIVDKVDNKGCFVWSFNLQKNKEKTREGKEVDKKIRNQTYTGKRVNNGPGFEQWLNEKSYNGKRVNEVRDFNQWLNEKYNQPPTVDINCSLWNMRKNKKKNEKKKLQHANPRQTSGDASNKRNFQRKVGKTRTIKLSTPKR